MSSFFSLADLPQHFSNVILALSYFFTRLLWLRIAATIGIAINVGYEVITRTDLRVGLPWDSAFLLINLYGLYFLYRDYQRFKLPAADAAMLRQAFAGLKDMEIAQILRNSKWQSVPASAVLITQNAAVENLYLIFEGSAQVVVDDAPVGFIEPGSFAGEIAYLTCSPATATVITNQPSRLLAIAHHIMVHESQKDDDVRGIIFQILGRDLTLKMGKANSAKASAAVNDQG